MKEHADEIRLTQDEVINLCNQAKQSVNETRSWIKDEAKKSKDQIGQWLASYIQNLKLEVEALHRQIDTAQVEAEVLP